ncbi:MAG: SirA family protein [Peptococcaceae bacterium]|nr:SirA family protein [Peptococcaceae bacterium]
MANRIDARGLLCPEPVLLVKKIIDQKSEGVIEVMVDNNAAMENITRLAENKKWEVQITRIKNEILMRLSK